MGIGFKADGTQALGFYRPTVLEFGADVTKAECMDVSEKKAPWEVPIPIPPGMSLAKSEGHPLLGVSEKHALRFRRV